MSLKGKSDIFESPSQRVDHIDPASIRLLQDRILVRDLGEPSTVGMIVIPQCALDKDKIRIGLVLAVGPGNQFIESGITDEGQVRRTLITTGRQCPACSGSGQQFSIRKYALDDCPYCYGGGKEPLTVPTQCEPGDRVLFSRRREAEFYVNGERLSLIFEEQSVLAVLEDQ